MSHVNLTQLGKDFEDAFSHVYNVNDEAHRSEHFSAVESLGLELNREMKLGIDERLITAVAWLHDMFAWSRYNHHELAMYWVGTTDHPLLEQFTPQEIDDIADACFTHRASYKGEFNTVLGELMSAADRGRPGDLRAEVWRGYNYIKTNPGLNAVDAIEQTVKHQEEKYGRDGYARYPDLYKEYFKNLMEAKHREIERLQTMSFDDILIWLGGVLTVDIQSNKT